MFQLPAINDPFAVTASEGDYKVGSYAAFKGRAFVRLRAYSAVEQGEAVMSVLPTTLFTEETLAAATAAGSKQVALANALTAVTAKMILQTTDGTGEGQFGVITEVGSGTVTVKWVTSDDEELDTALDTTTKVQISADYYVIPALAAADRIPVALGIYQGKTDVTAGYYFWAQVTGPGVARIDTAAGSTPTPTAGQQLIITSDTGLPGHLVAAHNIQAVDEGGSATYTLTNGPTVAIAVHDNNADSKLIRVNICCPLFAICDPMLLIGNRIGYAPTLT